MVNNGTFTLTALSVGGKLIKCASDISVSTQTSHSVLSYQQGNYCFIFHLAIGFVDVCMCVCFVIPGGYVLTQQVEHYQRPLLFSALLRVLQTLAYN